MSIRGWLISAAIVTAYLAYKNQQDAIMQTLHQMTGDTLSQATDLIKAHEGWSPVPYPDAAGLRTIGWGHKMMASEVLPVISQDQGEQILQADIARTQTAISRGYQRTPSSNQEAAFICFAFNVGATAFLSSTLLKKFNAGDIQGAADQFDVWNKAHVNGVLTALPGLTARRADEKSVFLLG